MESRRQDIPPWMQKKYESSIKISSGPCSIAGSPRLTHKNPCHDAFARIAQATRAVSWWTPPESSTGSAMSRLRPSWYPGWRNCTWLSAFGGPNADRGGFISSDGIGRNRARTGFQWWREMQTRVAKPAKCTTWKNDDVPSVQWGANNWMQQALIRIMYHDVYR